MKRFIPVAEPALVGNEKKYVLDCLDSTWISSGGKYIGLFEAMFAEFCGVKHALSCCNGTVALHLALLALGVGPGDEVIVPTLTFVATANAVMYCGAKPIFIDSEPQTWNLDPERLEELITPHTKAIIVVHLYGHPVDMDAVLSIARRHGLFVVEDAAEAHGAEYKGARVGSMGDISTFSFFGNKIITTGEGGMVVTGDDDLAARVRQLKGQGMDPQRRYWFSMLGYNYRMTNIEAAIGVAQLERADWHIERRRWVAHQYASALAQVPGITLQPEMPWARNVYWMTSVLLDENAGSRDALMQQLLNAGIETRPFFYPLHTLPMYVDAARDTKFPVAESVAVRGFNVPSYAGITETEIDYICGKIKALMTGAF